MCFRQKVLRHYCWISKISGSATRSNNNNNIASKSRHNNTRGGLHKLLIKHNWRTLHTAGNEIIITSFPLFLYYYMDGCNKIPGVYSFSALSYNVKSKGRSFLFSIFLFLPPRPLRPWYCVHSSLRSLYHHQTRNGKWRLKYIKKKKVRIGENKTKRNKSKNNKIEFQKFGSTILCLMFVDALLFKIGLSICFSEWNCS